MQSIIQRSKVFLGKYPLFLFLLPVFFIYSGYNELFGFLSAGYVLKNFIVIFFSIAVIFILTYLVYKSKKRSAIFVFTLALTFLTFGFIHDSLKLFNITAWLTKYTLLLPLLGTLLCIFFLTLKSSKREFSDLFRFLNLLFIILILSEIPNSIKRYQLDKSVHNLIDFRFTIFNEYKNVNRNDSLKPDIYLLVFDALGSTKSIQQSLGYNNITLDSFLEKNDFYVTKKSKANYNWTIFSVSTMLNLEYLPHWIMPVMNEPKVHFWGTESFKDNSLLKILKSENYEIYNYQPLSFNNKDWPGPPYFSFFKDQHYYYKTLPGRLKRDILWNFINTDISYIQKRQLIASEKIMSQKKKLLDTTIALVKNVSSITQKPKFVYAHFMVTHDPYIFDSSGTLLSSKQFLKKFNEKEIADYVNQLKVADSIIKELVTQIKNTNKKNTIIIVTGDHGYPNELIKKHGYSFEIFSSFYFPDKNYSGLTDSIQPVNIFRVLLNNYFGTNLQMLKDSSVFVTTETELVKSREINK